MWRFAIVVLVAGCGRLGFDASRGPDLDHDASTDGVPDAEVDLCAAAPRGDHANWHMPNDVGSGLPSPASYTLDPGNEIVTDNVTGLVWQRATSPSMMWDQAVSYCRGLELAGACDWRLPERVELVSLVDYSTSFPAIDPIFTATPNESYWAVTDEPSTSTKWNMDFGTGRASYGPADMMLRVRCVRGGPEAPSTRYQATVDTVDELPTELTWQRSIAPGFYTFGAAQTYCSSLALAGTGWRMPSIRELQSLVDSSRNSPAIDPVFMGTTNNAYWSQTPQNASPTEGWVVGFTVGISGRLQSTQYEIRCVRP